MIRGTLDSLRRLWYAEILVCAGIMVLAASPRTSDRYAIGDRLVEVLPRIGVDPRYYEQIIRGHNEFVIRHLRATRQKFESGLAAISDSGKRLDLESFNQWLNNVYDIPRSTINVRENPHLSEITDLLRRLDRPSNAADPDALLSALRQALPLECRPCSLAGSGVGPRGELVTSSLNLRDQSGQLHQLNVPGVPEYLLLRNARLSTQYGLLNRVPERSEKPRIDSDFVLAHVRNQSSAVLQDVWLEIKDMTIQDASQYIRGRNVETPVKLSLFGLTLEGEITGFAAPIILIAFQIYLWLLIEHIKVLWRGSHDVKKDAEVLTGYPWPPLFAGPKGLVPAIGTLVVLPVVASVWLFVRLTQGQQLIFTWVTSEWSLRDAIRAALSALAIFGAIWVAWRLRVLRAELS